MGRRVHALVLVVVLASVAAPAPARAEVSGAWVRPVDGALARAFEPPRTRFGAGHLGSDLLAVPGTPVRAAGPGIVAFAGSVAGARHVVLAHAGGLRTSYSFLASVAVRRGQVVAAGDVVGTTGGAGEGHDGSVLHFGLRVGDNYVDPMQLFRPVDLAELVHLAPTTEPPRPASDSSERRGLLAGLAHDVGAVVNGGRVVVHAASTAIEAAGAATVAAGRTVGKAIVAGHPIAAAAAAATAAWFEQQQHCDAHAPPADGEGGSGHRVMLVAGIESSLTSDQPSLALSTSKLGYLPSEVTYFSYGTATDYTAADTEAPIMVAARRLGAQLRAMQTAEPGREVDLIAHSQGGVVVEAFLTLVYKPDDRAYPPLGTVVTLSSPLRGDPLATSVSDAARTSSGSDALRAAQGLAQIAGTRLPVLTPAVRNLAADSALMRRLDAARLPDEVQMTAIGAATDVVVPGVDATRSGAQSTTVIPDALNAHTGILGDPSALRAVRAALEDRPLPCQSLTTAVVGRVISTTISTLEERAGTVGKAIGRVVDGRP